jgi:ribosome biogenesis GTPase
MPLSAFGWGDAQEAQLDLLRQSRPETTWVPARVVAEHRGAYDLITEAGTCTAEPTGRLRHTARDKLDLPAVGDWVALQEHGRIDAVLPRKTSFVRKAAGPRSEPQVIAANIDSIFIVTSANADFNARRIERYIFAAREGGAAPVLIVNKIDLVPDVDGLVSTLGAVANELPVVRVSALTRAGAEELSRHLGPQTTVALVGSSGVGKSTLVNWLLGNGTQLTAETIERDDRGRHTTTHRELLPLPGGGALIDTPGMKEFGLWSDETDASTSFTDIEALSEQCRFADCKHEAEPGCAVAEAVSNGQLEPERLASFAKLAREIAYQQERGTVASRQAIRRVGTLRSRALRQRKRDPGGGKLP